MARAKQPIADMFASVSLGSPDNAVGFVLWRLAHRFQREMDRALVPCGLTHLQFTTLAMAAWLCRSGEFTRQTQIARHGAIHPMQVSLMLKALQTKKLVSRSRDPVRANSNVVRITPEGIESLRAAMPLALEVQHRLFGASGKPGGSLLRALRLAEELSA